MAVFSAHARPGVRKIGMKCAQNRSRRGSDIAQESKLKKIGMDRRCSPCQKP